MSGYGLTTADPVMGLKFLRDAAALGLLLPCFFLGSRLSNELKRSGLGKSALCVRIVLILFIIFVVVAVCFFLCNKTKSLLYGLFSLKVIRMLFISKNLTCSPTFKEGSHRITLLSFFIILFLCSFNSLTASQIIFRPASDGDVIALQKHYTVFYSQELVKAGIFPGEVSALLAANEEMAQEAADSPPVFFYLIIDASRDICFGYIAYYYIDARTAYVDAIYLDQKYRGQGFGEEILHALEKELRGEGVDTMKLYVFVHNSMALKLYKKMNYLVEQCYFYNETPVGYHMKKEIGTDAEDAN